jgi:glucokinase
MSSRFAVGVDVGGTKIAFALVDETGCSAATYRLPTCPEEGAEAVFDRIAEGVNWLLNQAQGPVVGVGVGCPGYLNPVTGIVHHATNLGWVEVPVKSGLQARLPEDLPVWVRNDASAAALGEMVFGAARGRRDFVCLTLGTGVGSGAVVGGELFYGSGFSGMELGHMSLDPQGRLCRCGMRGCPEMYASGTGLLAGVSEYGSLYPGSILYQGELSTEKIIEAARSDDELAVRLMEEAVEWLCKVMVCCLGVLHTPLFVIGGGLGQAAPEWFIERARVRLMARHIEGLYGRVEVVQSQVASSAVGAACVVWHQERTAGDSA